MTALPLTTLLVLWAVFIQGLIPLMILFYLRSVRVEAFKNGEVKPEARYDPSAWPEKARTVANAYANQFELPVLFYVAMLMALMFGQTGWVMVILSWVFVITRIVHAFIHVTNNTIRYRFRFFLAGVATLITIWIYLALAITLGGAPMPL